MEMYFQFVLDLAPACIRFRPPTHLIIPVLQKGPSVNICYYHHWLYFSLNIYFSLKKKWKQSH